MTDHQPPRHEGDSQPGVPTEPQTTTTTTNGGKHSRHPSRNVDKDLPLNPDERAGLKAQKRQYTKELQARKLPEIDPNHAYPDLAHATTLVLCISSPSAAK